MNNMLIANIPTIVNCIKHTINDEREKIYKNKFCYFAFLIFA